MIYRSNLICPDLTPHFKHLVSRPMPHSFGHDVPSDWADKSVVGLFEMFASALALTNATAFACARMAAWCKDFVVVAVTGFTSAVGLALASCHGGSNKC